MKIRGKFRIVLAVAFLMLMVLLVDTEVYAVSQRIGTVTANGVNFRNGPGTNNEVIGKVQKGDKGAVLEGWKDSEGTVWYRVILNGTDGWVTSKYLKVEKKEIEFKEYLTMQGFPESYHEGLTALHEKYPEWIFVAQHTNLEWEDVIKEESKLRKNLVHTTSISSWKSTQTGAYDWTTSTWKGFDSSQWVAASTEIIQYYIDARNFLNEKYVFQFIKQSYDGSVNYEKSLKAMVKGTFLEGTFIEDEEEKTYVSVLLEASKQSKVDPYTIASMIIQEQGKSGTGGSISGKEKGYEGYYNFFNVGAYAANGLTPVQKGLEYAKVEGGSYGRPWDSITKSIIGGAQYYGKGYVQRGQDTIYLKKFNVQGANPYTNQYMTNIQGAATEGSILSKGYDTESRNGNLIFKIPVYKNMPENPCKRPDVDGSPNYMLKSLKVAGQSLTPTFSMYETEYSVIVPNEVSSVEISASAYDKKAKIVGTGKVNLEVCTNIFDIVVKAENGDSRIYHVSIIRDEPDESIKLPVLTSEIYTIDSETKRITGVNEFPIDIEKFQEQLAVQYGTVRICDLEGNDKSGNVGTGAVLEVKDGADKVKASYVILINGDTNGDGQVNPLDLLRVQKNILGMSSLEEIYFEAGDTSKDGKINALDLLQIQKHILGIKAINQ